MAIEVQLRSDTLANWTSANPVLSLGELVSELGSGRVKIGDGVTAYLSLPYKDVQGVTNTTVIYQSYGDGSDGNLVVTTNNATSGPLVSGVLTRDAYFNNLTISGSGSINTGNYRLFVSGILDISAAAAGAINNTGLAGNNASATTPGAAQTALVAQTVGVPGAGAVGATGTTTVGAAGNAGVSPTIGDGGAGGASGAGGTNGTNAGGVAKTATAPTTPLPIRRWETELIRGVTLIGGGVSGSSGSSGGGDGTNIGGAGGGAPNGGGVIALFARTINRSSTGTALGAIQSNGGMGGMGGTPTTGTCGGGGGAGGGGGGWIFLCYEKLTGSRSVQALQANGGMGGMGGSASGTASLGGNGGNGGSPGRIFVFQSTTGIGNEYTGTANIETGTIATTSVGGNGGPGGLLQVNL